MTELAEDEDPVVRGLVEWKASLAAEADDEHALQFVQLAR
jgi:hypothetical protein